MQKKNAFQLMYSLNISSYSLRPLENSVSWKAQECAPLIPANRRQRQGIANSVLNQATSWVQRQYGLYSKPTNKWVNVPKQEFQVIELIISVNHMKVKFCSYMFMSIHFYIVEKQLQNIFAYLFCWILFYYVWKKWPQKIEEKL